VTRKLHCGSESDNGAQLWTKDFSHLLLMDGFAQYSPQRNVLPVLAEHGGKDQLFPFFGGLV
jgi:hypothetical protein